MTSMTLPDEVVKTDVLGRIRVKIIGILRETDGKSPVKMMCAKHHVSEATFYAWKKYGGLDVTDPTQPS